MHFTYVSQATDLLRYITLQHEQASRDSYLSPISYEKEKDTILAQIIEQKRVIILFSLADHDVGFIDIVIEPNRLAIDNLMIYPQAANVADLKGIFTNLKTRLPQRTVTYITPITEQANLPLLDALGFTCRREHIQMEKALTSVNPSNSISNLNWVVVKQEDELKCVESLINKSMTHTSYRYTCHELNETVNNPYKAILLGYKGEIPIAFIIYEVNAARNMRQNRQVLYIEELGVHPDFRGNGYGQTTLSQCEAIAQLKHLQEMRLHVYRDNVPAYRLYEKNGYRKVKSIGHFMLSL